MRKIKFIKNWRDTKKGEIINYSNDSAKNFISQNYAKYINEPKKTIKKMEDKKVLIKNVISSYNIKIKGNKALCPFHADTNPSLVINEEKNYFNCFGCNAAGDPAKFVSLMEKISYKNACKKLKFKPNKFIPKQKKEIILSMEEEIKAGEFRLKKQDEDPENIFTKQLIEYHSDKKGKEYWDKIRIEVLSLILLKKKGEATEILVKEILEENKISTIRDDEKKEMWIKYDNIYIPHAKTFIEEFSRYILKENYTTYLNNQVIAKIEADTYIESETFFEVENPNEIPILNGVLNLKTKKVREYCDDDIFFNKINATFEEGVKCTNIIKHFKTVLKDIEDLPIMQEIIGYTLLRKHPIEKAIMLSGDGRNGKGKSLEMIKRFIGVNNCVNISIQDFEKTFILGNLLNKLANLGADISDTSLKETGKFKGVTGNDLLTCDRKFKPLVHFVNYSKQIFSANKIPITYDTSPAFWNRWVILEFPYKFVSEKEILKEKDGINIKLADTEIVSKLTTEREFTGLLNWALEGLERLLKNGDFSYNKSVEDVKLLWQRKSNSFNGFIVEYLEEDYDSIIVKSELKKAYSVYRKENKLPNSSDKAIKRLLEDFGAFEERPIIEGKQKSVWAGIKFKVSKGSKVRGGIYTTTTK